MSAGSTIGRYRLEHPLGQGGMGSVWAASAGRARVAIKVITGENASAPRFREAFRREARAAATLDHPNVVRVYDYGEISEAEGAALDWGAGSPYLVMELLEGGALGAAATTGWIGLRDALLAVLDGLAHAHARGIHHRDIKPDNILWNADRRALKLTDFGLAHATQHGGTTTHFQDASSGTPAYMAPEQVRADWRSFGPWTDLYALGCVVYQLVTGVVPFHRDHPLAIAVAQASEPPPELRVPAGLPGELAAWVATLLEKNPAQRFQRAADAAWALRAMATPEAAVVILAAETLGTMETLASEDFTVVDAGLPAALADDAVARGPARLFARPPLPPTWGRRHAARRAEVGLGAFELRRIPVVAREAERDALWAALAEVVEGGAPRVVALRGPAGSGKSVLAQWLTERAHEVGAATILCARHAVVPGPADGLRATLSGFLRTGGLDDAALRARMRALTPALGLDPEDAPGLAGFLRARRGSSATLSGGDSHRATLDLLARFVFALARRRPVVLWLDDLQWGQSAAELAEHLMAQRPDAPVLVLATVRDDLPLDATVEASIARLLQTLGARALDVGSMDAADRHVLLRAVLELDPELESQIVARTAGNPLFAVQLVEDWVHRGLIEPGPRGHRLRAGAGADALPASLHEVWSASVDALCALRPEGDEAALERAAALGLVVDGDEWAEACAATGLVARPSLVDALIEAGLARDERRRAGAGWTFAHGLLRESIAERARRAGRWADHHRACAQMLAARADPAPARIGPHLMAAGDHEAALAPLLEAAALALDAGDLAQATQHLVDLRACVTAAGLDADDVRRLTVGRLAAGIAHARGDVAEARAEADALAAAAARTGHAALEADALRLLGWMEIEAGHADAGLPTLRRAVEIAEGVGDTSLRARCIEPLATALRMRGEGAKAWATARRAHEAVGDRVGAARCDYGLARTLASSGRDDEAERWARRALEAFEAEGVRLGVAGCHNELGELARRRGDLETAERHYGAALRTYDSMGSTYAGFARTNLGLVLLERGRPEDALPLLRAAAAQFDARGGGLAAVVQAVLLATTALVGAYSDVPARVARVEALLRQVPATDDDAARWLRAAADAAGARAEAAALRDLAARMTPA